MCGSRQMRVGNSREIFFTQRGTFPVKRRFAKREKKMSRTSLSMSHGNQSTKYAVNARTRISSFLSFSLVLWSFCATWTRRGFRPTRHSEGARGSLPARLGEFREGTRSPSETSRPHGLTEPRRLRRSPPVGFSCAHRHAVWCHGRSCVGPFAGRSTSRAPELALFRRVGATLPSPRRSPRGRRVLPPNRARLSRVGPRPLTTPPHEPREAHKVRISCEKFVVGIPRH